MMTRFALTGCALALTSICTTGVQAGATVDLELSLVIDASGSINSKEFALQMNGYQAAFLNSDVQKVITTSSNGVAVNTIFFATRAKVAIPFTVLRTSADINTFASQLGALSTNRPTDIGFSTDIRDGINLATATTFGNDIKSAKQIIDVSGDGLANARSSAQARDAAFKKGIDVINALVVGSSLTSFFEDNVIIGDGATAFVAKSFDEFEKVVTNKVSTEIKDGIGPAPNPTPAPTGIPSPSAALAGLVMLGLVGVRRRRNG